MPTGAPASGAPPGLETPGMATGAGTTGIGTQTTYGDSVGTTMPDADDIWPDDPADDMTIWEEGYAQGYDDGSEDATPEPQKTVTVGAICAGYGGLELAASMVLEGTQLVWYAENAKAPAAIMAHHWPGIPNLGDITSVDWSQVTPVDVITGGTPCQDLSKAGPRGGMTEGTRSNLWVAMREAIAQLHPHLVIWENVYDALSAKASSQVEPCAGCVGDRPEVHMRALGRVAGDLASLGYDSAWGALRASDIGAPHQRRRIFLCATATDTQPLPQQKR